MYSDATGMEDDAQCGVIIEDLVGTISNLLEAAGDDFKQILETFVPNSVHAAFVNGVVQAFFQQDLLTATWQFFCRATHTYVYIYIYTYLYLSLSLSIYIYTYTHTMIYMYTIAYHSVV